MPGLLDGLKEAIIEALRPGTHRESGELSALRQLYDHSNAGTMRPLQWYRLHSANGGCVGFSFACKCLQEFQLLSAFEWTRDYSCPVCKSKFNLYKDTGITDVSGAFQVELKQIEGVLAKLPVRPRLAGPPTPPQFIDTWGNDRDVVSWDGAAPNNGWV